MEQKYFENLFLDSIMTKLITKCPKLHYSPERDLHILKINYSDPHIQREFFRRKRRKESGYQILIIKNKYSLAEPIGIQKENELNQQQSENNDQESESQTSDSSSDEKPENTGKNILKPQSTFKTFTNLLNKQDSIQNISNIQEPQYIANFSNFINQENYSSNQSFNQPQITEPQKSLSAAQQKMKQQCNSKLTESLSFIPQEDEIIQTHNQKLPPSKSQYSKLGDEKIENKNDQVNSTVLKSISQKKRASKEQIPKLISQYNHANQYKMFQNFKQNQENHLQAYEKVQAFKIPKMSFDEGLDGSDPSQYNTDDMKTPVNYPARSHPQSRRHSIQKKLIPHSMNQRSSSKDFHHSDTIQNLVKFNEEYNQKSHARLGQSMLLSGKIPRKSILKSNTVKIQKETLFIKKVISPQSTQEQKQMQQEMDISDVMKQFKYFYPMFNYQNVIQHYNMLKSIQKVKFPKYFNVYSIYNRKNATLRSQAQQFEQQPKYKQSFHS